jgi:hypothetical protein
VSADEWTKGIPGNKGIVDKTIYYYLILLSQAGLVVVDGSSVPEVEKPDD